MLYTCPIPKGQLISKQANEGQQRSTQQEEGFFSRNKEISFFNLIVLRKSFYDLNEVRLTWKHVNLWFVHVGRSHSVEWAECFSTSCSELAQCFEVEL